MKRNPNVRYVSRESNLRRYVYTARVCKLTGRLLGIRAGCRRWKNFRDALDHYGIHEQAWRRNPVACDKWQNQYGEARLRDGEGHVINTSYPRWWAERQEARELLRKLRRDVQKIQRRIRRRARGH